MKKNIIKLLSLAAVAVLGWSCETDYYNEHNLDGWESDTEITDVQTIEYTLEAADYATIANNATNKATAEAAGAEAVAALAAVKTNCYFTSATDAETYLKAFVVSKYNNYFSNGSSVSVNYNLAEPQSQEMLDLNAAKEYTLKNDDYKTVWGSETAFQSYVTPATMDKLADAISSEGLEAGDYVVVTYNYSEEEPSTGGDEPTDPDQPTPDQPTPDQPTYEYTSVLGSAVLNDAVTVTGYISAVSSQGPILTDKGGSVLLYKTSGYEIGDVVTVSGTISSYNKGFQIGTTNLTIEKLGTTEVTYPTPVELTGAMMDELVTTRTNDDYAQFVKMTGTITINAERGFYNFNVEGAANTQGSIYGITDEIKGQLADGQTCTLYGYFCSISSGRYINIVVVSVDEAPKTDEGGEEPTPDQPTPDQPTYEYTSVLGSAVLNDAVTVTGYISAVSSQGPILTDKGGSVLLYKTSGYELGDVLTVSGTISSFNYGFQIGTTGISIEKLGTTEVTYPSTAMELTGAKMDELLTSRTADEYAHYAKMTGTVAVSGNYYNFNVEGATTAVGSIYGATDELKAKLSDGMQCTLYGYFISISKTGGAPKYINLIVTDVVEASAASLNAAMAAQTEKRYGYYQWNGSKFSAVDLDVVQPADYEAMNNKYGSITYPQQEFYIPKYLNLQYPYAKEGDTARVAYRSYNSGSTAWVVEEYLYDGSNWARDLHLETGSAPYKKIDGNWTFDPSMTIVLNPDKSEFSKLYYMTAYEWVYNNKHEGYTLDNRTGNRTTDAEYYSGCAAGYTNLNWRINTLPKYYWGQAGEDITPYDNWSSEDPAVAKPVFELFYGECEKRFGEVMAAALGILHPNQRLIAGMDVIYTVQMMVYANASNLGSSNNRVTHAFEFKVVGDGQFEYVRMYALDPKFDLYYDFN